MPVASVALLDVQFLRDSRGTTVRFSAEAQRQRPAERWFPAAFMAVSGRAFAWDLLREHVCDLSAIHFIGGRPEHSKLEELPAVELVVVEEHFDARPRKEGECAFAPV